MKVAGSSALLACRFLLWVGQLIAGAPG